MKNKQESINIILEELASLSYEVKNYYSLIEINILTDRVKNILILEDKELAPSYYER